MGRIEFSPAAIMIGSTEAAETRRQDRVIDALREITDTGTSEKYGQFIETWEHLAVKNRTDEGLDLAERESLDRIRTHMNLTFGEPGVVRILTAWYQPTAEGKRAAAQEPTPQEPSGE